MTQAPAEAAVTLEAPWQAWSRPCAAAASEAAGAGVRGLFHGVGKPEVFLYGSYYLSGFLNELPLAKLRDHLNPGPGTWPCGMTTFCDGEESLICGIFCTRLQSLEK